MATRLKKPERVTQVTDVWRWGRRNIYDSMNSRLTTRRIVSLMLVLVVAVWAQSGLGAAPADGAGMHCRSHANAIHPAISRAGTQALSSLAACPEEHANSMPCCPSQSESLPPECGDRPCCAVSGEPVRPLAFLVVSSTSLEKRLSPNGPLTGMVPAVERGEPVARGLTDAPPYVQSVTEKKTDLRI